MDVERITVELGDRSYPVFVGSGLLPGIDELIEPSGWSRAVMVTDSNVGPLYAERLLDGMRRLGLEADLFLVEPGEKSKGIDTVLKIEERLLLRGLARSDLLVALGGGVVGDVCGFSASIYKRGLDIMHVPTTVMSQVDSSIGGKTAVNLRQGKNLLGAVYQPVAVISDTDTLSTLPEREFKSGLAEVVKYYFLSPSGWDLPPETIVGDLERGKTALLVSTVSRCARIKAGIVSADEFDRGQRAVLNYGHTMGHALESVTGYSGEYSHGEAVSVGMVYAAMVSEKLGIAAPGLAERHRSSLEALRLPTRIFRPAPDYGDILEAIGHDKKSRGEITMVLLEKEGSPVVRSGLDPGVMETCYHDLIEGG